MHYNITILILKYQKLKIMKLLSFIEKKLLLVKHYFIVYYTKCYYIFFKLMYPITLYIVNILLFTNSILL